MEIELFDWKDSNGIISKMSELSFSKKYMRVINPDSDDYCLVWDSKPFTKEEARKAYENWNNS